MWLKIVSKSLVVSDGDKPIKLIVLLTTILCCICSIYFSIIFGIGSLYKIGLENEIDSYTNFMFSANQSEPDFAEQATHRQETIDQLGKDLFSLNPYNPDILSLLAYVETSRYWDGINAEASLERSSELHRLTSEIRPVGFNTYAEEAFTQSYQGKPFTAVLHQLQLAQHFGPFEFATARAGIKLLFSQWSELNREQRLQAMDYMLSHKHYGLSIGQLNNIVMHSANKSTLCNVAKFAQITLRTCR